MNLSDETQQLDGYIKSYKLKHPNITIKPIGVNGINGRSPEKNDELIGQALIEHQPDLIYASIGKVRSLSEQGKLLALDS